MQSNAEQTLIFAQLLNSCLQHQTKAWWKSDDGKERNEINVHDHVPCNLVFAEHRNRIISSNRMKPEQQQLINSIHIISMTNNHQTTRTPDLRPTCLPIRHAPSYRMSQAHHDRQSHFVLLVRNDTYHHIQ